MKNQIKRNSLFFWQSLNGNVLLYPETFEVSQNLRNLIITLSTLCNSPISVLNISLLWAYLVASILVFTKPICM